MMIIIPCVYSSSFFFILKAPKVLCSIYICKEREDSFFPLLRKSLCQKYRSHSGFTVIRTDCTKESSILNSGALFNETECRSVHRESSWGINSIHAVMGLSMYNLLGVTLRLWLNISGSFACSNIARLASVWTFHQNYKDSVSPLLDILVERTDNFSWEFYYVFLC